MKTVSAAVRPMSEAVDGAMEVKPAASAGGIVDAVAHHQHLACRPCRALRRRRAWPAGEARETAVLDSDGPPPRGAPPLRGRPRGDARRGRMSFSRAMVSAASRRSGPRTGKRPAAWRRAGRRIREGPCLRRHPPCRTRRGCRVAGLRRGVCRRARGPAARSPRRCRRVPGRGAPPRAPGRATAGCCWPGPGPAAMASVSVDTMSGATSCGSPFVSVPVLSKITVSTAASFSSAAPSLIMMPERNRRPLATTCTAGTARPSAQGQVMMRTATAVISESCQPWPSSSQPASVMAASEMDGGRIEARQPVGDADIARLALFGRRHEPDEFAEECVVARRRHSRP